MAEKNAGIDKKILWEGDPPDKELAKNERKKIIESVLNMLYPSFMKVIVLREYGQMSYDEIAQVTGLTFQQ